eukprot:COSAG02_NODE_26400_length_634_cov_0.771963_1_plen_47_part_01
MHACEAAAVLSRTPLSSTQCPKPCLKVLGASVLVSERRASRDHLMRN